MSNLNFDAGQVEPQSFEVLPEGIYTVHIVKSELKPTKDNAGERLILQMTVLEGPHKGRIIMEGLNLKNSNPTAVKIAQQVLSSICYVTGVIRCQDSSQLHQIPFTVKVGIRPAKGEYAESNVVREYRDIHGNTATVIARGEAVNRGATSAAAAAIKKPLQPTNPAAVKKPIGAANKKTVEAPDAPPPWVTLEETEGVEEEV